MQTYSRTGSPVEIVLGTFSREPSLGGTYFIASMSAYRRRGNLSLYIGKTLYLYSFYLALTPTLLQVKSDVENPNVRTQSPDFDH